MSTPTKHELQNAIRDAVIQAQEDPTPANKGRVLTLWRAYQDKEYRIEELEVTLKTDISDIKEYLASKSNIANGTIGTVLDYVVINEQYSVLLCGYNFYLACAAAFNQTGEQGIFIDFRPKSLPRFTIKQASVKYGTYYYLYMTYHFPHKLRLKPNQTVAVFLSNGSGQTLDIYGQLMYQTIAYVVDPTEDI